MSTVQDIEHAVGEHARALEFADPGLERGGVPDLRLERRRLHVRGGLGFSAGGGAGRQRSSPASQYSNTFTTLRTPPVVRATSVALSASASVTSPSR